MAPPSSILDSDTITSDSILSDAVQLSPRIGIDSVVTDSDVLVARTHVSSEPPIYASGGQLTSSGAIDTAENSIIDNGNKAQTAEAETSEGFTKSRDEEALAAGTAADGGITEPTVGSSSASVAPIKPSETHSQDEASLISSVPTGNLSSVSKLEAPAFSTDQYLSPSADSRLGVGSSSEPEVEDGHQQSQLQGKKAGTAQKLSQGETTSSTRATVASVTDVHPLDHTEPTVEEKEQQEAEAQLTALIEKRNAFLKAKNEQLTAQIAAMKERLESVTKDLKNPNTKETVQKHIELLHKYNEIRDVGQGLLGLIAEQRGVVRVKDIYEEFGVGATD